MHLKNILVIGLLAIVFLSACRKKKDEAGKPNTDGKAPSIEINGDVLLRDTFKFSNAFTYNFTFNVKDDQEKRELTISKLDEALVIYKNNIINNGATDLSGVVQGSIGFRPLRAGFFAFSLTVKDPQGLSASALVELNALANQLPVAKLNARQTNQDAPLQVSIDAAASFDADARWGGRVTQYEYLVEGFYTTQTTRSKIEFIYPKPGSYRIGVRVQDNDGAWSPMVYQQITVN
jgi:hypothetical protein